MVCLVGYTAQARQWETPTWYVEWASDYYVLVKARSISYIRFLIHRRYWNMFLSDAYAYFLFWCTIFGKGISCFEFSMAGTPCFEFSMAVSAGRGTGRLPPAAASNRLGYPLKACYDRDSSFWLQRFVNDGAPKHKIVGVSILCCISFCCMLKRWDVSSGSASISLQNQSLSEV